MFVNCWLRYEDSTTDVGQRSWFFVFQQPVVMTILVIAQEIT